VKTPHLPAFPSKARSALVTSVLIVWIAMSLLTIRATLPRWMGDESLWRSAIVRNSDNEIVQYNLTAALLRNGRVAEAAAFADRFSTSAETCARCDIEVASASLDQANLERATTLLERVAQSEQVRDDLNTRAKYHRVAGELELTRGNTRVALTHLDQAASLQPDDPLVHVLVAEASLGLDEFARAERSAANALRTARRSDRQAFDSWHDAFIKRLPREPSSP